MEEIGTSLLRGVNAASSIVSVSQNQLAEKQTPETSFASVLSDALDQYGQIDNEGDYTTLHLLTGSTDDLSSALISTEKAEIALNLTVAVRNKAVEAYKEIMNMQI